MKKVLLILFILVMILALGMVAYGVENQEINQTTSLEEMAVDDIHKSDSLKAYVEEKIIPILIGISASVIAFLSTLKGVFSALKTLKETTQGYESDRIRYKEEMKKELECVREKYSQVHDDLKEACNLSGELKEMQSQIKTLSREIANVSEIACLGFSNDESLVKDGISRKISIIAEQNKELIKNETI